MKPWRRNLVFFEHDTYDEYIDGYQSLCLADVYPLPRLRLYYRFDPGNKWILIMASRFTAKQGQYLAFIHNYVKINRRPPAEADMQRYFSVTPPTVHQMVVKLEALGLIERQPGVARSIKLLVDATDIPRLI